MTSSRVANYLRSHRKRLALSQDEIAYLLGSLSGTKVCRHEWFVREPGLQTALAYEVIFQRPVRELFAGLYRKVENEVIARAKALAVRSENQALKGQNIRKRQALTKITDVVSARSSNPA